MVFVGIDDTDVLGSKGTNQLAKAIVLALQPNWRCVRIVRHQLLDDPRVPYTSKNGSASISLQPVAEASLPGLTTVCRRIMRDWYVEGSDPGLCIATAVDNSVIEFGRTCKVELVTQNDARDVAAKSGVPLEGLGGTNGGIIGALAAVGLIATEDDGRIVQLGNQTDELRGVQRVEEIRERGVEIRNSESQADVSYGTVDLIKKLRPNLRGGRSVLFVRPHSASHPPADFEAIKRT